MRKILIVIVGMAFIYVCIHFFVLPESPDVARIENITRLRSPAYNPAVLHLWEIAVEETGVENESAVLLQLETDIAGDGAIRVIWLFFYGEENGERHVYEAYVGPDGTVAVKSQKIDHPMQGVHPLALLREVDAITLEDIPFRERGMTLLAGINMYGAEYNETHGRLYEVSGGRFRPMKEVVFGPEASWYTITITPHQRTEGTPSPGENPDCIIAFTRQDLGAADSIVCT
ncbi:MULTISPECIES: hypothetical protein [unclassified Methanoculleus]|jgi:hypothetical protein|uniref:Uncharacterized protein n=1 Tax=Methanoculleus palmolei TaxID=72612 RepID=A0ABD8AAD7_9EURY|nr:hypothetical protein [Methanoculleus sp. UBA377]MDD2472920.1 hypothetical protein [Methanoculleus sp.]WOX56496.1 hypothetical protein R6Y95_03975 [Methanoculleus palmolei]